MESIEGRGDDRHRFKGQPDDARDEVGELEGCFPFAQSVGGEDLAGFDGDLTEACDEKFATDDQGRDPDRTDSFCRQDNEGGTDKDFVSQGVEQFAERRHEVHFPREPAIYEIAGGGNREQDQGGDVAPRALPSHKQDEKRSQNKTREGNGIWEVHGPNVQNWWGKGNKVLH